MQKYRSWLSPFLLAVVLSVALSFPIEPEPVAATQAETFIHGWLASDSGQLKEPLWLERLLPGRGTLGAHPGLLWHMLGPRGCYFKAKEQGFANAHHTLGVVYGSALGLARNQDAAINQPVADHTGGRQLGGHSRTSSLRVRQELSSEQYGGSSIGTAWPIASGYVVTNNHVVSHSNDVLVITASGQQIRAWAVIRDEVSDIALLEVSDSHKLPPALPLATSQASWAQAYLL